MLFTKVQINYELPQFTRKHPVVFSCKNEWESESLRSGKEAARGVKAVFQWKSPHSLI